MIKKWYNKCFNNTFPECKPRDTIFIEASFFPGVYFQAIWYLSVKIISSLIWGSIWKKSYYLSVLNTSCSIIEKTPEDVKYTKPIIIPKMLTTRISRNILSPVRISRYFFNEMKHAKYWRLLSDFIIEKSYAIWKLTWIIIQVLGNLYEYLGR